MSRAASTRSRSSRVAALAACLLGLALVSCKTDQELRAEYLAEAEALIEQGEFKDALKELRNALKLSPEDADANFRIAAVLHQMDRLEDAIFFYGEAYRLDPGRSDAAIREAELLIFDDPVRMNEILDALSEREPGDGAVYVVRSRRALIETDLQSALTHGMTAVELSPENPDTHLQLAKVHEARILSTSLAREPLDPAMYEAALASLERAMERRVEYRGGDSTWREKLELAKLFSAWPERRADAGAAHREAVEAAFESGREASVQIALSACQKFAQRTGDRELVRWSIEKRLEGNPGNIRAWLRLAGLQGVDGDPGAVYARLLEAQPDNPEAHKSYAEYLASLGRVDEAGAHLEAQVEDSTDPTLMIATWAEILRGARRQEEAQAMRVRLREAYPGHPRAILSQARDDLDAGRTEEAAVALRDLAGRTDRADAHALLAHVEHRLGNRRQALASVERVIDLGRNGPFPLAAMRLRSQIQAELLNCEDAIRGYGAIGKTGNKLNTMDRVLQAGCLYETGHPDLGHSILYKLVRGERAPAWIALVYARRESERRPKVVRALLEEVLARDSDQPMVLARLARLDVAAGLPEKALERLNQAIAAGPVAADVMFERARILATRGDLPGAQSDALQAFSVQPALPGLSALLIRIYSAQGQIDEAIASFEEANAVGALEPPARMLLARMHIATSNRQRALELLEELLAENDALAGAKNDLAYLLALDSVDLDRALRLGQEAQRALPRISQVADTLGFVYLKKGLHEPALEQFRYAVKLGSEHDGVQPVYHYHAGRALQELGRTEEAATQFEEALALDANYEDAAAALRAAKPDASDELTSAASS